MLQGTELLDLWWCGECWGEGGGSDKMAVQMINKVSVQFSLTFCDPMDFSMPDFPVLHQLLELTQTHVHRISDATQPSHLILCCPLLLQPSIFPSIRVFSSESVLHIEWPKYWNYSFSISPSNEYSGLISFRIDWLNLFAF